LIPTIPPIQGHDWTSSPTASFAFDTMFVSPFTATAGTTTRRCVERKESVKTKKTKKRLRDHHHNHDHYEPHDVCDLTVGDSDDGEIQPRQAPSSFGSDQTSGSASSDSHTVQDSLEFLTKAFKSQRIHPPHPSHADLRELRVAFFTKLFA
jgi:hypothetical protein